MTASMDSWKAEAQYIKSRCGFCQMNFDKWQDRADHLAKEFRNGADMKNWKGCRGLDAHVAIHVTNAMPPYLIANESKSPFPFSASNTSSIKVGLEITDYIDSDWRRISATPTHKDSRANASQQSHLQLTSKDLEYLLPNYWDNCPSNDLCIAYQDNQEVNRIGPILLSTPKLYAANEASGVHTNATCWEILTLRLGRFARQHIEQHGASSITDEMLQREARMILYGEADGWEQTAADNSEWLNLFKKAHGIDTAAPDTGIKAHHEVYEDLGIHSNSVLDESFNVNNFQCLDLGENHPDRSLAMECSLSGTVNLTSEALRQTLGRRSSSQQTPQSNSGLSGSNPVSPRSRLSQAPIAGTSPMVSLYAQCAAVGKTIESANIDPQSFSALDEQACQPEDIFTMPAIEEKNCNEAGELIPGPEDFQFPSWDQLPADFQNPTTSADFDLTIPISTTTFSAPNIESTTTGFMSWDNDEMNFTMDMDMDLDMDLNTFGKS